MKPFAFAFALLLLAPAAARADITKEEILRLKKEGLHDDVVVAYIKANAPVEKLSADDIIGLAKNGISTQVLVTMISNARKRRVVPTSSNGTRGRTRLGVYVGPSPWHSSLPYYYNYLREREGCAHCAHAGRPGRSIRPRGYRHLSGGDGAR